MRCDKEIFPMNVFPAFDTNYTKRKRTLLSCQACRIQRKKCKLSKGPEVGGCDRCIAKSLQCDLKSPFLQYPRPSQELGINPDPHIKEKVDIRPDSNLYVYDVKVVTPKYLKEKYNFIIDGDSFKIRPEILESLITIDAFSYSQSPIEDLEDLLTIYFKKINKVLLILDEDQFYLDYSNGKVHSLILYCIIMCSAQDNLAIPIVKKFLGKLNTAPKLVLFVKELEFKIKLLMNVLPDSPINCIVHYFLSVSTTGKSYESSLISLNLAFTYKQDAKITWAIYINHVVVSILTDNYRFLVDPAQLPPIPLEFGLRCQSIVKVNEVLKHKRKYATYKTRAFPDTGHWGPATLSGFNYPAALDSFYACMVDGLLVHLYETNIRKVIKRSKMTLNMLLSVGTSWLVMTPLVVMTVKYCLRVLRAAHENIEKYASLLSEYNLTWDHNEGTYTSTYNNF